MPRTSYDYSSISDTTKPTAPKTPEKIPLSPPATKRSTLSHMEFSVVPSDVFFDDEEARSISRLHRAVSALSFWRRRSSGTKPPKAQPNKRPGSKKIRVAPPDSPFFRHGAMSLNQTLTTDTASTLSSNLPDSPASGSLDAPFEPIVSSSTAWLHGDSDCVSLLLTSPHEDTTTDNHHGDFETIWFPRSDEPWLETEDDKEAEIQQIVSSAEIIKEELDEFSEAMSKSSGGLSLGNSQVEDEDSLEGDNIKLEEFQKDLSIWFRVRERFSLFLGGKKTTKTKEGESNRPCRAKNEVEVVVGEIPDSEEKENAKPPPETNAAEATKPAVESISLPTPNRRTYSMDSPVRSEKSAALSSPLRHNRSNMSNSSKSAASSLLRLNWSHDKEGMETLELEFPATTDHVDLSHLEEHSSVTTTEWFGFADLDANDTAQATTPIAAIMDPNDHCAQLVLLKSEKTKPGHVRRPSGENLLSAASSSCFSSLMLDTSALGDFSGPDHGIHGLSYIDPGAYCTGDRPQDGTLEIDDSDFHQSLDNETPVARSRRLRASASQEDSKLEGETTNDPLLKKSHAREGSQDSLWDELESATNTPYDEPCQEEALPDTPQRLARLQKEANEQGSQEQGFLETVQSRLFQPIMQDFSSGILCCPATAVKGEMAVKRQEVGVTDHVSPEEFDPYSDVDYAAAAAESAAYDSSVGNSPGRQPPSRKRLQQQHRISRSISALEGHITRSTGTRTSSISSLT